MILEMKKSYYRKVIEVEGQTDWKNRRNCGQSRLSFSKNLLILKVDDFLNGLNFHYQDSSISKYLMIQRLNLARYHHFLRINETVSLIKCPSFWFEKWISFQDEGGLQVNAQTNWAWVHAAYSSSSNRR